MATTTTTTGERSQPVTGPVRRALTSRPALLGLLFVVVTLLMYRPTPSSMRNSLPWNLGDPALNTWILAWEHHAVFHHPTQLFGGNIFFPYGDAINYSELMLPVLPVFSVVYGLTGNAVLAHNVSILALSVLTLGATYLLARRLLGRTDVAIVSALAFAFGGFVFMHVGHLQLLTLGFFPLAFHALFRVFEHPTVRRGVWLGGATFLLVTACFYFGAIWMLCLATCVVVELARARWRPGRSWWIAMGSAAIVAAVTLAPVAYSYASFQRRTGFKRQLTPQMGLKARDLLLPAPGTKLYPDLLDWASNGRADTVEHGFFPGFLVGALALIGFALFVSARLHRRRTSDGRPVAASAPLSFSRRQHDLALLAASALVSLVVAVGPSAFGVVMPERLLYEFVPGYDGMKAVSRLAVPALLALAVFAGVGLDWLLRRARPAMRTAAVVIAASLVLLELSVSPIRAYVDRRSVDDAVYTALKAEPQGAAVELPIRSFGDGPPVAFIEGPRMLATIGDWRPRFNGFSGDFPKQYFADGAVLNTFPAPAALDKMHELGLRFVVLHGGGGGPFTYTDAEAAALTQSLRPGLVATRYGNDWLIDLAGP